MIDLLDGSTQEAVRTVPRPVRLCAATYQIAVLASRAADLADALCDQPAATRKPRVDVGGAGLGRQTTTSMRPCLVAVWPPRLLARMEHQMRQSASGAKRWFSLANGRSESSWGDPARIGRESSALQVAKTRRSTSRELRFDLFEREGQCRLSRTSTDVLLPEAVPPRMRPRAPIGALRSPSRLLTGNRCFQWSSKPVRSLAPSR